jgi:hypothetical protein
MPLEPMTLISTCSSVPPENCNPRNRFGSLEAAGPIVGERLLDFRLHAAQI